jgi:epoxyqueuosine reductase
MEAVDKINLTWKVHEALRNEGFDIFGITEAAPFPEESDNIAKWIAAGRNGSMKFMERDSGKRADITLLAEGARSVIVAGLNYFSDDPSAGSDNYFVSRYARVRDYHEVLKEKLTRVASILGHEVPDAVSGVFCDSAPLTEKAWAIRAGLGWRGRNSLVLNEDLGSFFFLGEIVTSVELVYDRPDDRDRCGICRRCSEACPTGAICDDRTIDARRCIAYLTIEHKGELPEEFRGKTENIIFGCDRCQEVCPWNSKARRHTDPEFETDGRVTDLTKEEWLKMTPEEFKIIFSSSPVIRTGYGRIRRNIDFVTGSPEKR